jgi:pyruvate formate lyase activating enzyme
MQGCLLKCKYCQNRDTWDTSSGEKVTSDDLITKVKKYKKYIDFSGGGITVTGGEPLLQVDFLIDFFKKLKKDNFHTAIDTSRYV